MTFNAKWHDSFGGIGVIARFVSGITLNAAETGRAVSVRRFGRPVSHCPGYVKLFCILAGRQPGAERFGTAETCFGQTGATRVSTLFVGSSDAIAHALGNEPTLDMWDCAEGMESQFTCGRCRLDARSNLTGEWSDS